jgi:GDSL-like lipase/acylhydrolase family protein
MGAALCSGCLVDRNHDGNYQVGIIGDSNTSLGGSRTSWVTFVEDESLLPQVHALSGRSMTLEPTVWSSAAIVGFSCVANFNGKESGVAFTTSAVNGGVDAIVSALGTNDLVGQLATPEEVVSCYRDMQAAAAIGNVPFFVATTPPVYPPHPDADYWNGLTSQLNALVRATFKGVIDFDTGFTPDMYLDDGTGLHLNDAGQHLRAERVVAAIKAAQ